MAKSESPAVLRDVQTLFSLGTIHGLTDAQLLDRFRSGPDPGSAETAFAGLVARHGSMVMGVCRRALNDPHDVADAFQATFLILVRKAESVEARDSLGRWLYGVSRRVALRAKRTAVRRSARESDGVESLAVLAPQTQEHDLPAILDEEIGRLPEKYRAAVILCDLQGLGQEEAARQLGCATGTVKSRLSRGREKLRSRLIRRGVAPAVVVGAWCGDSIATAVPAAIAEATAKAAIRFAAGQAGAAGVVSASVIKLTQGVLKTMLFTNIRILFTTTTAIAALATGAGVLARQATAPEPQGAQSADREGAKVQEARDKPETDKAAPSVKEDSNGNDEERNDRIDALQLDIELLSSELTGIKNSLSQRASAIRSFDGGLGGGRFGGRGGAGEDDPARVRLREMDKQQRESSLKLRETYLEKSKELRQKQRELAKLLSRPQSTVSTPPFVQPGSVASRPSSPVEAKDAPALEQRINAIERKLDEVMTLLKELKR
ncbi:RNA polymerase sigma-70 factor, ECF subfamily [Singulisphaera sp. GP187]|uniref:RNA polymerase sigma factor n=1 Tax=Singulisphaera sp. GP187 TaxID=1882752 RepID=UPI000926EF89|nr:RNA polymerase sigma factor [Singulisphaera sp. GP187]SIO46462.1 RNA polymerase sigma-70 factor, ECF subfamily [Singulisphaera sp. GP187]